MSAPKLQNLGMAAYNPVPIEPLETARLLLRPTEISDAPRIQELFDNFNLLRYMNAAIPWPYPETGAVDFLERILPQMEAREAYAWSIFEKVCLEQGLIGHVALFPLGEQDHRGFWLGEPYWGRGYMTEVCLAVTDFAFGPVGMNSLSLNNALPNVASHRLKQKAGAEIVRLEERDYIGGRFTGVEWKLTAAQWAAHRAEFITAV